MVTLQFSTTSHLSSALIRLGTWSWASHVDLVLPDGMLLGAIPGGVQIHLPNPAQTRSERYVVDAPEEAIRAMVTSQIGKPYDYRAVAGIAINRDWQSDDAWFCSELVAWAFQRVGHPLLRADHLNRVTPRDLLLSVLLTKEG